MDTKRAPPAPFKFHFRGDFVKGKIGFFFGADFFLQKKKGAKGDKRTRGDLNPSTQGTLSPSVLPLPQSR